MAELHVIGQILGATGFGNKSLFCSFKVKAGHHFVHIEGDTSGQTHIDTGGENDTITWSHPIDLHFSTPTPAGWPKLILKVYFQDFFGRTDFAGYGVVHFPTKTGSYKISCPCWKPIQNNLKNWVIEKVIGGSSQLEDESYIWSGEGRRKLTTQTTGNVILKLNIIQRNFKKFGCYTNQENIKKNQNDDDEDDDE